MIGVDVDQSNVSDRIITSAMKALSNSVVKALTDASANDWIWPESYAGVCQYLGAADDCVGLPMETSQFTKFTQEQYDTLFQAMADGSLVVFRQEMDAAARSREFGLGSAGHNVFSETVYFT